MEEKSYMDLDFWERFGREILHGSRFLEMFWKRNLTWILIFGNVLEEKSYMDLDFWERFGREILHGSRFLGTFWKRNLTWI